MTKTPWTNKPHTQCAAILKATMAEIGADIHVSTQPPLVAGPYTTDPMTCPHGTPYWYEPTGEQIAAWVRDGVK